jgi:adenylosuccinate synthase
VTVRCAHLVVDLGFGDAGKGHVVDALVRRAGAEWVVRSNGGAQAGHTVVLADGRVHTFAQIGAGTFAGARTWLAAPVVVHPTALAVEAQALASKGVHDVLARVSADARCRVITPWHQAANRLRELARGDARHGSCGVGFGETVADSLAHPGETIELGMLREPSAVRRVLARVRERKREELRVAGALVPGSAELRVFEEPAIGDAWLERACAVAGAIAIVDADARPVFGAGGDVVLEGAQGVLLDEHFGFQPYTTWSTCTFANADATLDAWGWAHERRRIGVLRSYSVRHGPGPLPSETDVLDVIPEPHNVDGPWQGRFRRGFFDLVLARYAIECVGGIDMLALTHLDALARDLPWHVAARYEQEFSATMDLSRVVPELAAIAGGDGATRAVTLRGMIVDALSVPIGLESYGPLATDVRFSSPPW